jgi:8-oxo-dGTP diphosphatase
MHTSKSITPTPVIVATDVVLFTIINNQLHIRLVTIDRKPHYTNSAGLPGGLIFSDETAEESAIRNLRIKSGIHKCDYIEQLTTMSEINRDPRSRVVSVTYLGVLKGQEAAALPEHERAWWVPVHKIPKLAFDHNEVVRIGIERLTSKLAYSTLACFFLPSSFTLSELQEVYEIILGMDLDKRNFRKKILSLDIITEVKGKAKVGKHRPAAYYKCNSKKFEFVSIL